MTIQANITPNGRMSLPVDIRKRLGLVGGGAGYLDETPNGLVLRTTAQAVARAQALAKRIGRLRPHRLAERREGRRQSRRRDSRRPSGTEPIAAISADLRQLVRNHSAHWLSLCMWRRRSRRQGPYHRGAARRAGFRGGRTRWARPVCPLPSPGFERQPLLQWLIEGDGSAASAPENDGR